MRIIVTGGAGFIGSNLVRMLVANGHQVLTVDKLTYAGNLHSLRDLDANSLHKLVVADLCDANTVSNVIEQYRPDWIMHLAAESHVDRSIDGPTSFIHTNIVGTFNLLQASRVYWESLNEAGKSIFRFLHVSTDEVYGSLGATGYFSESTPYDPRSPYSASKAASDHLVRAWHSTYGLPVLVTNCSNNYGPYQFPEKLIPVIILKCLRHEPIPVYGKGENIRDWLYVEDHCTALLAVASRGRIGQTYNIGGCNEKKNIEVVEFICGIMDELLSSTVSQEDYGGVRNDGTPWKHVQLIRFVADRPGHDMRYAIDPTKIKTELGWSPTQDHGSGFRNTVKWYLENREWWGPILDGTYQLQRLGIG
jgi:dTDP-glucose 4,6-dehydratase